MKLICAIVFAFGSLITAHAQEVGASRTAPDSAATLTYIHGAWEALTRRVTGLRLCVR